MPVHKDPQSQGRIATAPYNFVQLPGEIVTVAEDRSSFIEDLAHNRFQAERLSGHLEVSLETLTPLYIRGMIDKTKYAQWKQEADVEVTKNNWQNLLRNNPEPFKVNQAPVLPASSLKGMISNVLAIASYSKINHVDDETRIFTRAVAAPKTAIGKWYYSILGEGTPPNNFESFVEAGYLTKEKGKWYICPCQALEEAWEMDEEDLTSGAFIKLGAKERDRKKRPNPIYHDLPAHFRLDHAGKAGGYRVGHCLVSFDYEMIGATPTITRLHYSDPKRYPYQGTLIATGDMLDTNAKEKSSPREKHVIIPLQDEAVERVEIPENVVNDYKMALTPFQIEKFGPQGVLQKGHPVFFLSKEVQKNKWQVYALGHNPNFRVPVQVQDETEGFRAIRPRDLVPSSLRQAGNEKVDFMEALFGFIPEKNASTNKAALAGRIQFGSATLLNPTPNTSYYWDTFTPRILGGPKPTAYPLYLTQQDPDRLVQTNRGPSDMPSDLNHYGSKDTVLRGHKRYWANPDAFDLTEAKAQKEDLEKPSQLTQIRPLKPKLKFGFKIYFRHLKAEELGALLWAIQPEGKDTYVHRLGMAKSLGLGVVRLKIEALNLQNPENRYGTFIEDNHQLATGLVKESLDTYLKSFENKVLAMLQYPQAKQLSDLHRIAQLLCMMENQSQNLSSNDLRHQSLEEFKKQRVLPSPEAVLGRSLYDKIKEKPIQTTVQYVKP